MITAMERVEMLRNGKPLYGDYVHNRYTIAALESNNEKTMYCFSVPIYKENSNVLYKPRFEKEENIMHMQGTNSTLYISKDMFFQNSYGRVKIATDAVYYYISDQEIHCGDRVIYSSYNGITCHDKLSYNKQVSFIIEVEYPEMLTRINNKCFAIMYEQFIPLFTVSCIGAADLYGNIIKPANLECEQIDSTRYKLTLSASSPYVSEIVYEMNMYEQKLFQDTTVESNNPQSNNAFGGVAFIGNTSLYGEQWLYIRPDMEKIPDIDGNNIKKAVLHMPLYVEKGTNLRAYCISTRFCSFGSNWNNKIPIKYVDSESVTENGYVSFDITHMYAEYMSGYIIKPEQKQSGFTCIATGDNYDNPVILELVC